MLCMLFEGFLNSVYIIPCGQMLINQNSKLSYFSGVRKQQRGIPSISVFACSGVVKEQSKLKKEAIFLLVFWWNLVEDR